MNRYIRFNLTLEFDRKLKEYCGRVGKKESQVISEFIQKLPDQSKVSVDPEIFLVRRLNAKYRIKAAYVDVKLARKIDSYCAKVRKSRNLVISEFVQSLE